MCCNFSCCASIASCLVSSFQTSLHTCSPHDLDDLNADSTYRNFLAQVPQEDPIVAGKRACNGYLLSSVVKYSCLLLFDDMSLVQGAFGTQSFASRSSTVLPRHGQSDDLISTFFDRSLIGKWYSATCMQHRQHIIATSAFCVETTATPPLLKPI
jgi:hypothetical protein